MDPNKGKATAFSPGKRALGTNALATVEETEKDQDENDIEDFVAFSIKSLEPFLMEEPWKTDSGFMRIQPTADQYEDTTIETTDVRFTFRWRRNGGGKHDNLHATH